MPGSNRSRMRRVCIFASFWRGPQLVCTLSYTGKKRTNGCEGSSEDDARACGMMCATSRSSVSSFTCLNESWGIDDQRLTTPGPSDKQSGRQAHVTRALLTSAFVGQSRVQYLDKVCRDARAGWMRYDVNLPMAFGRSFIKTIVKPI
jgi:hypothetical protein